MKNKAMGYLSVSFILQNCERFKKLLKKRRILCVSTPSSDSARLVQASACADEQYGFPARRAFLGLLLVASFLSRYALAHSPASTPVNSFVLPQPKALRHFDLVDHSGNSFGNDSFEGRWTFILFGYTHCPDVCPTTLLELREVRRILTSEHGDIATATVFVSVDPQRDTRERLADYVARFGEGLRGVRGAPASVKAFADQFQVRYAAASPSGRVAHYVVDHTASVALVGPDGRLNAVFMLPLRPARTAADVARLDAGLHAVRNDIHNSRGAR